MNAKFFEKEVLGKAEKPGAERPVKLVEHVEISGQHGKDVVIRASTPADRTRFKAEYAEFKSDTPAAQDEAVELEPVPKKPKAEKKPKPKK
jgi:hypothetical protein